MKKDHIFKQLEIKYMLRVYFYVETFYKYYIENTKHFITYQIILIYLSYHLVGHTPGYIFSKKIAHI